MITTKEQKILKINKCLFAANAFVSFGLGLAIVLIKGLGVSTMPWPIAVVILGVSMSSAILSMVQFDWLCIRSNHR